MRACLLVPFVLMVLAIEAQSQTQPPLQTQPPAQLQAQAAQPSPAPTHTSSRSRISHHTAVPAPQGAGGEPPAAATMLARPGGLIAEVTLADIGFVNGLRFANLGGHNDLFVPLPQDADVAASELVLALDDVSAYESRRHLEVQRQRRGRRGCRAGPGRARGLFSYQTNVTAGMR